MDLLLPLSLSITSITGHIPIVENVQFEFLITSSHVTMKTYLSTATAQQVRDSASPFSLSYHSFIDAEVSFYRLFPLLDRPNDAYSSILSRLEINMNILSHLPLVRELRQLFEHPSSDHPISSSLGCT